MNREFITSGEIKADHVNLPIKQIYLWFITSDSKIAIVGNGKGKFQFPGGKPEEGESLEETLSRETFEECGIKLNEFGNQPSLFGYYLVENDPNWPDFPRYLQLRYYVFVDQESKQISLSVNERTDDIHQMQEARFVELQNLAEFIPWVPEIPEYKFILELSSAKHD